MNHQQTASSGGAMNSLKWTIVFLLVGLGILGNYHYSEQSTLVRVVALFLLAMTATWIAFQTNKGKQFWQFLLESRVELRKVVWPNRKETVQMTMMVLAVVAIVGTILWGIDIALLKMVAWITGYGAR